jgi:hypothetical protein
MERSTCYGVFVSIGAAYLGLTALAAGPPDELSPVIVHVLTEGKTNNIPPAFSRALGLSTNKPAAGKVVISRSDTETNSFWASLQDTNAAVIMTRKANLCWYYLTDASGQLHRAIVNDANIYHGGGTNLSLARERERFEAQKRKWLAMYLH